MIAMTAGIAQAQLLPDGPGWSLRSGNGISWKDFMGEDQYFGCDSRPTDVDHLRRPPAVWPRGLNQVERELLRCYEVRVRNVMDRPIQCIAVVEQVHVPRGAGERVEGVGVINPGLTDVVVNLLGSASQPPKKIHYPVLRNPGYAAGLHAAVGGLSGRSDHAARAGFRP